MNSVPTKQRINTTHNVWGSILGSALPPFVFQASLAPKLHLEEVLDSETYKNEFASEVSLEKVM